MPTVISQHQIYLPLKGSSIIRIEAGVERVLSEKLAAMVVNLGAEYVVGSSDTEVPELVQDVITLNEVLIEPVPVDADDVAEAIKLLMDTGAKLTATGQVRVKDIENLLGYDITMADRDAGMEIYENEIT